jgi:hypothetical protein
MLYNLLGCAVDVMYCNGFKHFVTFRNFVVSRWMNLSWGFGSQRCSESGSRKTFGLPFLSYVEFLLVSIF